MNGLIDVDVRCSPHTTSQIHAAVHELDQLGGMMEKVEVDDEMEKVGDDIDDMGGSDEDDRSGTTLDSLHITARPTTTATILSPFKATAATKTATAAATDRTTDGNGEYTDKDKGYSEKDASTLMSLSTAAREKCPSCGGRRQGVVTPLFFFFLLFIVFNGGS